MICIYVALGKTKKEVKEIYYDLTKSPEVKYILDNFDIFSDFVIQRSIYAK